jgi:hypothetical protein
MANRSDFYEAKLPRYLKRMLTMAQASGHVTNAHEAGAMRRAFIAAHANHVGYKLRRPGADTSESED